MSDSLVPTSESEWVQIRWTNRVAAEELTAGTAARYRRVYSSYERFIGAFGCSAPSSADSRVIAAFIDAPRRNGSPPARSTSRFRLTVVRDAYAGLATALGTPDPTAGLSIADPQQSRVPMPLTPAEVARLRASGRISPRDHLRPAAVELALAGGSHLQVATAVVADLDLRAGAIRLGSRCVQLEAFALATLTARVAACRRTSRRTRATWDPAEAALALRRPLRTYPETSIAPGISSSLSRALAAAGVTRLGLRPASLREFAANRVYALSDRIEDVAAHLGLDSLDVALGFIDDGWQAKHRDEVRAVAE